MLNILHIHKTGSILFYFVLIFLFLLLASLKVMSQPICEGDSVTLIALDGNVSGDIEVQWQYSYDGEVWEDFENATDLTYVFYPVTDTYLRLKVVDSLCLPPYYTFTKFVELTKTIAYAGEDQIDIEGNVAILEGNEPDYGTGTWSIQEGEGGEISDINDPNSVFTGQEDVLYTLKWEVENECGTAYDEVTISFVEEVGNGNGDGDDFVCGDILVDPRDGKEYATTLIGEQCWMAENLDIGVMIQGNEPQADNDIIEKHCYENDESNCDEYGGLYQWDELMQYTTIESTQGICPPGWHVPSDDEWKELEMYLGMTEQEANLSNTWRGTGIGTMLYEDDDIGFYAQNGAGSRGDGNWHAAIGSYAYYYTSTEGETAAWRRCLSVFDNRVGRYDSFSKDFGFSARCVKDDEE